MNMRHLLPNRNENGIVGLLGTIRCAMGDDVRVKDEHATMNLHDEGSCVK
jgi:hypothetical protein